MQTTTINPDPNQYFRKVKTDGTFKKTFKVLGLYFTVSNCRVKKRISCGYSRQGHDGKLILQAKKGSTKITTVDARTADGSLTSTRWNCTTCCLTPASRT